MNLGNGVIDWCSKVKYLGVFFRSARHLVTDIDVTVWQLYISSNAVFSNCKGIDELIKRTLQETYCLPILCYALRALKLSDTQGRTLNSSRNSSYRKIFGFKKLESAKSFIQGLDFLDFKHIPVDEIKVYERFISL